MMPRLLPALCLWLFVALFLPAAGVGQTATALTTAGETTAGETTAGETTAGETTAGETTAGETTAGETTAGETTAGETTAGETTAFARQPLSINADRLEADDVARQVRFVGNVVARQGEVVLYADEMVVSYRGETREIERIEAFRDVRIVQGVKVATGEKGIFFRDEARIVLTGSPKVHHGKDFVEGDEIVVLLNEDRSIVRSEGGSRVNAVFHPAEAEQ